MELSDAHQPQHFNGVTILDDGLLMIDVSSDAPFLVERTDTITALKDYLNGRNTPFLYIRVPSKLRDSGELPWGHENEIIENGDLFLSTLRHDNVDTIDLRAEMLDENMDFAAAFFRGDIH